MRMKEKEIEDIRDLIEIDCVRQVNLSNLECIDAREIEGIGKGEEIETNENIS